MKRGFLKTEKAKRKLDASADSAQPQADNPISAARQAFLDSYDAEQAKRKMDASATGDSKQPQADNPIAAARRAFLDSYDAEQAKRKLDAAGDSNQPQADNPIAAARQAFLDSYDAEQAKRKLDTIGDSTQPQAVNPIAAARQAFLDSYDAEQAKRKLDATGDSSQPQADNPIAAARQAFLDSYDAEKAKRKLDAIGDSNQTQDEFISKGKGKEKEREKSTAELPNGARIVHAPSDLDLHALPPSVKPAKGKKRYIFLYWPRDPKGKMIKPSEIHGKEAGNGIQFWGATLHSFYFVRRIPDMDSYLTISTASKLSRIMKAFGELDYAKDQLALAACEPDPVEIPAWNPAEAIAAHERRVFAHFCPPQETTNASEPIEQVDGVQDMNITDSEATKDLVANSEDSMKEGQSADATDKVTTQQIPSTIPVESPFHPSHYPPPWPLEPFRDPSPYLLQRRIPIHLLPKKLYVHDPWNVADTYNDGYGVSRREGEDKPWGSMSDRVRTYNFWLPRESREMTEEVAKIAALAESVAVEAPETRIIPPKQETEGPTEQPAICALLPKRPRKPTEIPEAHLYLSPKARLGSGNHSVVYEAELELPRDLFCDTTICQTCLDEQIDVEVNQLKESGEWDRLLNDYVTKEQGPSTSNSPSTSELPPRYVGFISMDAEDQPSNTASESLAADPTAKDDCNRSRVFTYKGMVVTVRPKVQWQTPSLPDTLCKHQAAKLKPVPKTARFRVAAKLSLPYDSHLDQEARNYLKFPTHFFEHWSGYNVVPPCHDPTPVGALVPQFYGYYKPDKATADGADFLSPILLIEHCGKPISVKELSVDDRYECAALLFRFHYAGWLHESFAERNILMQKGHPTCSPLEETKDPYYRHREYSFRLIDFGRSMDQGNSVGPGASVEAMNGKKLFGIMEFGGML